MGYYAYKEMLEVVPPSRLKDWDGCADYDSLLYSVGADYIHELKEVLKEAVDDFKSMQNPTFQEDHWTNKAEKLLNEK